MDGIPDRRLVTVPPSLGTAPVSFLRGVRNPASPSLFPTTSPAPSPDSPSSSLVKVPSLLGIAGGLGASSRFIFSGPTAFIGPDLEAALPAIDFPPLLMPILAAGTPIADLPPAVAADFKAILGGAKPEVADGRVGREAPAVVDAAFDDAGEGSLAARPDAEDGEGARFDAGEGSRRTPAEEAEGFINPPVDARFDLGGGNRLLPANVGFAGGFCAVAFAADAEAAPVEVTAPSRGPSAVFLRDRGA